VLSVGNVAACGEFREAWANRQDRSKTRTWLRGIASLGWLAISAIPVIPSDEGLPHALRSVVIAPAAFLLAAWGAAYAYQRAATKMPARLRPAVIVLALALISIQPYLLYFESWARRPEVPDSFLAFTDEIAGAIGRMPNSTPKYVVLSTQFLPVRGIPLIAQPIMYLTGSFTARRQVQHHIYYVTTENAASLGIGGDPSQPLCDRVRTAQPYAETFCIR